MTVLFHHTNILIDVIDGGRQQSHVHFFALVKLEEVKLYLPTFMIVDDHFNSVIVKLHQIRDVRLCVLHIVDQFPNRYPHKFVEFASERLTGEQLGTVRVVGDEAIADAAKVVGHFVVL